MLVLAEALKYCHYNVDEIYNLILLSALLRISLQRRVDVEKGLGTTSCSPKRGGIIGRRIYGTKLTPTKQDKQNVCRVFLSRSKYFLLHLIHYKMERRRSQIGCSPPKESQHTRRRKAIWVAINHGQLQKSKHKPTLQH